MLEAAVWYADTIGMLWRAAILILFSSFTAFGNGDGKPPAPPANVEIAHVPDKTCPFVRGADSIERVKKGLTEALTRLNAACEGAVRAPIVSLHESLGTLLTAAGVRQLGDKGKGGQGIFGISITCDNYQKLYLDEYEYAEEGMREGRKSFPSDRYRSCFEDEIRADRKKQESCLSRVYSTALTDQKHNCLFQEDAAAIEARHRAISGALVEVTSAAGSVAQGINRCGQDGPRIVDAVLSVVGVVAGTAPGLGIYGAGAAFGANALRELVAQFNAAIRENKSFKAALGQAALAKLGCLYTEALDKTMLCQARKTSAADRARFERDQALAALGHNGAAGAAVTNFYESVKSVAKRIEAIRDLSSKGKKHDEELDGLLGMLGFDDKVPPERRPLVQVPTMNGQVLQFSPQKLLFNYLVEAATALENYSSPGPGVHVTRDRQVRAQGKQLNGALKAIYAYVAGPNKGGEAEYKEVLKQLQVGTPVDPKAPRFDMMETLWHLMSSTPILQQMQRADLLSQNEPPPADFGAQHGEMLNQFFGLLSAMGEDKERIFDTAPMTAAMKQANPPTDLARLEEFTTVVEPLLRACALLGGTLLYDKGAAGTLTMKPQPNLLQRTFTKPNRTRYEEACKRFQCTPTTGLPPFQNFDDVNAFTTQQCQLLRDYDAHRLAFQDNYVRGNRQLCPPANWQSGQPPGNGH